MKLPTMTPLKSSNIKEVGHVAARLFVRFNSGKHVYSYPDESGALHKKFVAASSPGGFFREHVMGLTHQKHDV